MNPRFLAFVLISLVFLVFLEWILETASLQPQVQHIVQTPSPFYQFSPPTRSP